jgi:5-methylcytosine-specific restriction endonuclease McrA
MPTYRQIFGSFKKTLEGRELKSSLYREQLFMCCGCMKSLPINKLELHHLKPLSLCEKEGDLQNVTNYSNLVLLCRHCNAKQSNKPDNRFN